MQGVEFKDFDSGVEISGGVGSAFAWGEGAAVLGVRGVETVGDVEVGGGGGG